MSSPPEPANNPKPVLKDKNPHNYRKVGYSMIVISVSLVAIGLLTWAIGDDYHFSTNIMAAQEVDAMTPKSGYNIVLFDASQPVGAKLKLLDQADSLDAARALQAEYAKQNTGNTIQVIIFNATSDYNTRVMANAEVYLQTPKNGYNVVLFNDPLPVGQKLTLGIHEDLLSNATDYQKAQEDNLQGQDIQVLIFTPNFRNDLKMITGTSVPVGEYKDVANYTANSTASQPPVNQTASAANSTNVVSSLMPMNNASSVTANQSSINDKVVTGVNVTAVAATNQTLSQSANVTQPTNQTFNSGGNMTSTIPQQQEKKSNETNIQNAEINATGTAKVSKSIIISEKIGINATGK